MIGGWSLVVDHGREMANWGRQAVEMEDLIHAGGASGLFLCLVAHFFGWGKVAGEGWLVTGRNWHADGRIALGTAVQRVKSVQGGVQEGK